MKSINPSLRRIPCQPYPFSSCPAVAHMSFHVSRPLTLVFLIATSAISYLCATLYTLVDLACFGRIPISALGLISTYFHVPFTFIFLGYCHTLYLCIFMSYFMCFDNFFLLFYVTQFSGIINSSLAYPHLSLSVSLQQG